MSSYSFTLPPELQQYVLDHTTPPTDVQQQLIERTAELGGVARMQISAEQGELLTALVALLQPRLIVEVGTFTGYSALAMALALPPEGRLIACDVSEEWTAIARDHWEAAGVADRIDLRLAPAIDTLSALPSDAAIDLAFIDADKGGYSGYYEAIMERLAPTGVILVDNTLWSGAVVDPGDTSDDTEALRAFNDHVAADDRVRQVIIPIGDGLTLIRHS